VSRPRHEASLRQLAIWVPADVKAALEKRAREQGTNERHVVTEALTAHLRAAVVKAPERGKKAEP
jgi:hypothetical protein